MIQEWQIKIYDNRNYPDKIRDDIKVTTYLQLPFLTEFYCSQKSR